MSRDVVFLEASVKRNMLITSASETKIVITKKKDSQIKSNKIISNKNNNEINLPLIEQQLDMRSENDNVHENVNTSLGTPIVESHISSSAVYDDPEDETYVPDESYDTSPSYQGNLRSRRRNEFYDQSPTSYLCMNIESAPSLLNNDPQNLDEALQCKEAAEWQQAMQDEYQSLINNNTWSLVDVPTGKKIIPCKWVYKTKLNENGDVTRYKARLVIKGFQQTKGIDYHEIYAPVVRHSCIRYIIGLAVKYKLKIHQMDVVTAFLQGDIDEEIYMSQPPSFEQGEKACRLNKAIYGLKQASRLWNKTLNATLLEIGMTRSMIDPCIYYRIITKMM